MLDRMDAFPHLDDYDRPMSVSASLALSCSTSDYSMTTSSGAPLLTPEMSQSPALPGMLPPSARTASPYPDISMVTPLVGGSPGSFSSPVLSNFHQQENRQILVDHFCDSLVQLLVFKEEPANPFRQLILPMSRRSSAVMNAIFAVSAAHMEHRGIENVEKSLDFHSRTIQGLTKLIENPKSNRDEALAVIMLLVYFEIVRSGSTLVVNSHLRGAMSIMRTRRSNNGPTSNFLEKTFRYFDVMCSLSTGGSPMSGNVPLASNRELLPVPGSPSLTMVDIVFGLVTDLWPIVHRMAHIVELKHEMENEEHNLTDRAMSLRAEFETAASTLELALHQWTPRTPGSFVSSDTPSEDSKLQSMVNNAEAYKQASLVFLFRTIRGLPRHAEKVQVHAKQALQACLRVIVFAGPMSTLLWPLFISSCEAIDEVDRDVSRSVFTHLDNRQGMQNIVHALDITHEVWRRQNEGHESHWKTVCHDMDRNIVFG
ncbi:MAG: hypothetical protein M4579_001654 [Chaenotheca gracillima]|nr:MAG: hypothetical protein M4579_001654 [Chaenotheca gracillima]